MGLDFERAIQFLEVHDIPVVLGEEDKCITENSGEYNGLQDFMLVHKTRFAPTDSKVKSAKEAEALRTNKIKINGTEYTYSYTVERNTIHFSVNDEVSDHAYGNWSDVKYAVLIPFVDVPKSQIGMAASMDTFTVGGVNLTENSWILCPKGESEKIKSSNPGVRTIEYEGESVQEFSPALLSRLGYRKENVGMWAWGDENSQIKYNAIMAREGLGMSPHTYTHFAEDEKMLESINRTVAIFSTLKRNNLVKSKEDISRVYEQLNDPDAEGPTFSGILSAAFGEKRKGLQILYEKLGAEGIIIPDAVKLLISRIPDQETYDMSKSQDITTGIDLSEIDSKIVEDIKASIQSYDERYSFNRKGPRIDNLDDIVGIAVQKGALAAIERTKAREEIEMEQENKTEER